MLWKYPFALPWEFRVVTICGDISTRHTNPTTCCARIFTVSIDNSIVTEKIGKICFMNGAQRREFVRNHRTCVFGYPRKAHGPSMSCVYYVMDGDDILVLSMLGRAKPKAVKRNGRVSLCILDEK